MAFSLPNTTHLASPLDVSVYGPFKTALSRSLGKRTSLSNANLGDWIEPAYTSAFSKSNIRAGFQSTGIWDQAKQSPNFLHVSTQYHHLISELDSSFKKKNETEKKKVLLSLHSERLSNLLEQEEQKLSLRLGSVGGKAFRNRSLSGSIVEPNFFTKIEEQSSSLQERLALKIKEDKDMVKNLRSLHAQKLALVQADLRKEKRERVALQRKYDRLLTKQDNKQKTAKPAPPKVSEDSADVVEITKAAFGVLMDNGIPAKHVTDKLTSQGSSQRILKRSRSFYVQQRSSKRKR